MYARMLRMALLACSGFCTLVVPAFLQGQRPEETLSGPDSHETGQGPHGHLFGEWGGERTRLEQRGVRFDFQYVSDSLANIESEKPKRFASWNRFRWTSTLVRWLTSLISISMRQHYGKPVVISALT